MNIFFKLMRKFYIILLLSTCFSFSQNKGTVKYGLTINPKSALSDNQFTKSYFNGAKDYAARLKFNLYFTDDKSLFELEDGDKTDTISLNFIKSIVGHLGQHYTDKNGDYQLITKLFPKDYLVKNCLDAKWELVNESKTINGYKCLKAQTFKVLDGELIDKKIIAWYCPAISVNHGPNGIYGLNGLILEVEDANYTLTMKCIDLKNNQIEIKKPTAFKEISQAELNAMIDEKMLNDY
jgi:GLPGLI family protein